MTDDPFHSSWTGLQPDWIDYNGHLNMAFYNVLFDRGADAAFNMLECGKTYREQRNFSIYTAEIHVCYLREVHEDAKVRTSFQLLDHDAKRLHAFQQLIHEDGWVSATSEVLYLHVDMAGPKVAPFPADIMANVEAMAEAHARLPRPERAGRQIAITRKP